MQTIMIQEDNHIHIEEPRLRDLPFTIWNIPRMSLLALIRLYQMLISPTLPSNYMSFLPYLFSLRLPGDL